MNHENPMRNYKQKLLVHSRCLKNCVHLLSHFALLHYCRGSYSIFDHVSTPVPQMTLMIHRLLLNALMILKYIMHSEFPF